MSNEIPCTVLTYNTVLKYIGSKQINQSHLVIFRKVNFVKYSGNKHPLCVIVDWYKFFQVWNAPYEMLCVNF